MTGGVALENPHPNPAPEWLSDKAWGEVVRASNLPALKGFYERKLMKSLKSVVFFLASFFRGILLEVKNLMEVL